MSEPATGVVYGVTEEAGMRATGKNTPSRAAEEVPPCRTLPLCCGALTLLLLAAMPQVGIAQNTPAPADQPNAPTQTRHHKKAKADPEPPPPPVPTVAPSLFQVPAEPATVTESNNVLTVKADNSSLSEILHQVATATGMHLEGLGGDERVFGNFGPGAPRSVLTALLDGTAYNVMMIGDLPNGAPRELLLTSKASGSGSAAPPAANAGNPAHNGDEDTSDENGTGDDTDDQAPPMQYTPPSITPQPPPRPQLHILNGPPPQ